MKLQCPQCGNVWVSGSYKYEATSNCCPLHPHIKGTVYVVKKVYKSAVVYGEPAGVSAEIHGYYSSCIMGGKVPAHTPNNN